MLSIVIFLLGVAVTMSCSLSVLTPEISWYLVLIIDIVSILGMIAINGLVALTCCKLLPNKIYKGEKKIFNPSKKETSFYEKIGIKKWKDLTIDLGKLNGFKKDKIENSPEYIERFIVENNKGFLDHFISLIISSISIFILPMKFWLPIGLPIVLTSIILNILPIMILRYNMPRLKTMLKFSLRNKKNDN